MTTPTDELPPFETRLLAELTDVVEDRRRTVVTERTVTHPRRTRLAIATAGVAAVAIALALAPGLVSERGTPAFAVRELPGGIIEVDLRNDDLSGTDLAAELGEFGIDVDIETYPASPSLVGDVYLVIEDDGGEYVDHEDVPGLTVTVHDESDLGRSTWRFDPEAFADQVRLSVGVETPAGRPYQVSAWAFEPGEVLAGLHCAFDQPMRASDVVPHLDALGLDATWELTSSDGHPGQWESARVDDVPTGWVQTAFATDASTVAFHVIDASVVAEDDPQYRLRGWLQQLLEIPCTPEQAAAWD